MNFKHKATFDKISRRFFTKAANPKPLLGSYSVLTLSALFLRKLISKSKLRQKWNGASLLLLFLFFSSSFAPVYAAPATEQPEYIIKLTKSGDYSKLQGITSNITHNFTQTSAPKFQNIYTFSSSYSLDFLQGYLKGDFEYLQLDRQIQTETITNDPGFTLNTQEVDKQWGIAKAGFNFAWDKTTGSRSNIVALIDTGIDQTHEDLRNINYVQGFDFLSRQSISVGSNSDDNGHGTLVSGVLGATANNGVGIVGTNWQISLMPLKALDSSGKGDAAVVSEAIVWAADHGAQFINLSIGGIGFGHDTALADAITYAFNKNVVIVAAAGNDVANMGSSLDQNPVFPICDDNNFNMVIGVAATDQNDLKSDFSNYGHNCIDVTAPGKRILSTIDFDPLSKRPSPNSYAYASGTSLAVPFVVGQAALIKALYPVATNVQIRDRIISTADNVDNLNLSQCAGGSCRALLGAGRINVPRSLEQSISQSFNEGDLVKVQDQSIIYQISGGQKRLVSTFVLNQKFSGVPIKSATAAQLANLPDGPYVTPTDGTLVKFDSDPTVYFMQNGQKLPVTYQVFLQRKFSFAQVNTLTFPELNTWSTGGFLAPVEGTLIKTAKNKTVYWVVSGTLHPINYNFFVDRGLNIFPIMIVSDADINGFAKGEAYIR